MESSGPARSGPTRCRTTHAPLIGSKCSAPGRTMRPETRCGTCGRAACMSSRTASLHIELPKIFGTQVLEVFLQLVGRHLVRWLGQRFRGSLPFLEQKRGEEIFLGKDRRFESERDRDAVRRTRVYMHRAGVAGNVKLRVKSAVLDFGNVDTAQCAAHADDEILAEVVRERPLALELVHLDHDRFRLRLPDPYRKQPGSALLLKYHNVGVGGAVETKAHHFDFDELHQMKLTLWPESGKAGHQGRPAFLTPFAAERCYRPSTAFRSSDTRSRRSHVKSMPFPFFFGVRPKCPYDDVGL